MKKWLISAGAFVVIVGSAWLFKETMASQKVVPPERPRQEIKTYVSVLPTTHSNVATKVEAYGRVSSSQQVNITAEVGGKLLAGNIPLKAGQNFTTGQLLCKIHNVEQSFSLQARKSTFLNLLASILPDLKIDFKQSYPTWQSYFDAIDLKQDLPDLPQANSSQEKTFLATKNILSEFYNIKSMEENMKKYFIYAPYTGSISNLNVEVGSVVNSGTTIGTIIRTDLLELVIPCELKDITYVEPGKRVEIVQEGLNEMRWSGRVVRIADRVDPNTQSVNVFIAIQNFKSGEIYDGLYLKAEIPGKVIEKAMVISRNILRNKNEVFVVEHGVLKTRKVNVLKINGDDAIITGLGIGETLVIDVPTNASNNLEVEIINDKNS
ncbi:MAG: efflux RND transporter periplasmic adaptor subunit [Bacteroidetes bacterium]|nr:efflux RND transporter periplasmic adaptor subunit [Bacteroidota bacterium]MDA1120224.1 efflux RND transporter periplasmic adaptor subunit [Bacteroidota bacterium]